MKELRKNAAQLDLATWPGPLIRLYLENITPEDVWAGARNPDPTTNTGQACEANFYLGEWAILKGRQSEAADLLRKARAGCPQSFIESTLALAELTRLHP
jgi:lipoprotein NlpI